MSGNGNEKTANGGGRDEMGLTPAQRTWLEHMRQCETEGLTYKAYCQREGLSVGGLYAVRKKLRGVDSVDAPSASSASPPRFAAVRVAHPDDVGTADVLLPNGVQMRVTLHDVDGLVRLVQGLSRLST